MPTVSDIRKSLSSTPPGFEEIAGAAKAQLKALDVFFTAQMPQFEPQMRKSVTYCLKNRGKRLRPLLVFFCGAKKSAKVDEALVRLAATIELVHLATLVHDDVMDEADLRHGTSTLNALSGPTIAVLLGDSLFAHALELAADFDSESICKPLTRAARRVCAGEVWQTTERGNHELSVKQYFDIIDMKTAELFHISCLLGGRVGGYKEDACQAFGEFGRRLGRAYQIYDDLDDILGKESAVGKTLGTDLLSGKYTLPTLLLLKALSPKKRQALLSQIKNNRVDTKALGAAIRENGILEKIVDYFRRELSAARKTLAAHEQLFPAENLGKMTDFVAAQFEKFLEKKRG